MQPIPFLGTTISGESSTSIFINFVYFGPDLKYLKSLKNDNDKRDYLGEFLFKKIENHPLTLTKNLTIDEIGKITGVILDIEDILEIIDIFQNNQQFNNKIQESLELILY